MKAKIKIRWVPGRYGGWTVTCQQCPSVVVRESWPIAMMNANRHLVLHERGPFTVPRMGPWDGFHYDNLWPPPVAETH